MRSALNLFLLLGLKQLFNEGLYLPETNGKEL